MLMSVLVVLAALTPVDETQAAWQSVAAAHAAGDCAHEVQFLETMPQVERDTLAWLDAHATALECAGRVPEAMDALARVLERETEPVVRDAALARLGVLRLRAAREAEQARSQAVATENRLDRALPVVGAVTGVGLVTLAVLTVVPSLVVLWAAQVTFLNHLGTIWPGPLGLSFVGVRSLGTALLLPAWYAAVLLPLVGAGLLAAAGGQVALLLTGLGWLAGARKVLGRVARHDVKFPLFKVLLPALLGQAAAVGIAVVALPLPLLAFLRFLTIYWASPFLLQPTLADDHRYLALLMVPAAIAASLALVGGATLSAWLAVREARREPEVTP